MNKTLIALVVIIVVAAAAFIFWDSRTANAPSPSSQNAEEQSGGVPADSDAGMQDNGVSVDVGGSVNVGSPVVVSYTNAGFSPSSITIKKGQAVSFMNNSSAEVWPASAIHPTHGVYPQKSASDCLGSSFDACRGLAAGESWEFTFTHVGTWRYHDHLHTSKTGTIVVTE